MNDKSEALMWPVIVGTAALSLPAIGIRLLGATPFNVEVDTAIFGLAIIAAAFILAWAAEASEVEISQGLAVAAVALIAVLPEYAVDMTFAWKAGHDPAFAPYAIANMTGGNRLLIGFAWPLVFFIFWWRARGHVLQLEHGHAIEVVALAAAAVYSFILPLKGDIALYDTLILASIFIGYVYLVGRQGSEEPELIGPARTIGMLPRTQRRIALISLFVYAATAIFASAEPFAEGLIHTGARLGIDEFLLVQWLAPLASEAPEFLFAGILAWRGRAAIAMGVVLSSAVNQWTLLIGGLPLAYSLSGHTLAGLPLDGRQMEEVLLTAGQCIFAVAAVVSLSISFFEAGVLVLLFALGFAVPSTEFRLGMAALYVLLTLAIGFRSRRSVPALLRFARQGGPAHVAADAAS